MSGRGKPRVFSRHADAQPVQNCEVVTLAEEEKREKANHESRVLQIKQNGGAHQPYDLRGRKADADATKEVMRAVKDECKGIALLNAELVKGMEFAEAENDDTDAEGRTEDRPATEAREGTSGDGTLRARSCQSTFPKTEEMKTALGAEGIKEEGCSVAREREDV